MKYENMADKPIGIFDSGVGGLTVLKEIHARLPAESTIYMGDTARVPYGIRSAETVIKYSLENSSFLVEKGIKLLIIACNTASAVSLNIIRNTFKIPVLGVIEPGAKAAAQATKNGLVGVIGTEATIKSGAYGRTIRSLDPRIKVIERSCPLFVPLVEEGWLDNEVVEMVAQRYLTEMKLYNIDTLVLGCTHYPLLKKVIKKVMGDDVVLIDSAIEKAKNVAKILTTSGLLKTLETPVHRKYYVTDCPDRFQEIGKRFMLDSLEDITKIEIASLEEKAMALKNACGCGGV
ncbi:glutamate racemase [Candidatus Magnetominusculus xianensis]|uniref:Glutamate racemase n=1 Tax=Candidatus Magnetominusculus xianensis TaxID=1748249 RepID=A0ABR5SCT7_9BACT|nr:glutamate racemase [Candidatus Magnetominusculus xianensis]KWT82465.1 glutamate racemase [Candidatus Magnetominusculus xianensis]